MTQEKTYPVGTRFRTRGRHPKICVITDMHTTRNLAGEIVRIRYVATHQMCGMKITDSDVCETTIAMGLIE